MVYQTLDVNLFYTGGPPQWIYITQGDENLGGFKFNIINENSYWSIPSGTTFFLNGTRPDGYGFSYPCTWSGYTVSCTVQESLSEIAGEVRCVLSAYDTNNATVGSTPVIVYVEKNPLSDITLSQNDFKTLNNAIKAAATAQNINIQYVALNERMAFTKK